MTVYVKTESLFLHLLVKLFQDSGLDLFPGPLFLGLSLRLSVSGTLGLRDDLGITGPFQEIGDIVRDPLLTLNSDLGFEL